MPSPKSNPLASDLRTPLPGWWRLLPSTRATIHSAHTRDAVERLLAARLPNGLERSPSWSSTSAPRRYVGQMDGAGFTLIGPLHRRRLQLLTHATLIPTPAGTTIQLTLRLSPRYGLELLLLICGGLGHTIAELLRGAIVGPVLGAACFWFLFYGLTSIGVRVEAEHIRRLPAELLAT